MKIKKLFTLSTASLLAFSLAACSDSSNKASSGTSEKSSKDDSKGKAVEITYARGADTTGSTKKLIDSFEKSHPNIKIHYREMPNSSGQQHDQYVTAFSSKSSEIDVFDADVVWPAEFAQANYAMELDRFIDKDHIKMNDYFPGAAEAAKFDGKQWAMPKYMDAGILFYRKDLIPNPPQTWDELIAQAKQAKGKGGTTAGYVMQANQYEGLVVNAMEFIGSYGGKIIDENNKVVVNSPETIKGLKKMVEVANSGVTPNNLLTYQETETERAFNQGQTALARNWPYMAKTADDASVSKVKGKFGYTTLPKGDKGSASTLGGYMAMINRYTDHPKEAWEFVKFMTGPEGQTISAVEGGRAPTIKALYEKPEVQKARPLFKEPFFIKTLNSTIPRPVTPNYQKISDIIQIEVSKALSNSESVEQAVQNMETKIKAAIK